MSSAPSTVQQAYEQIDAVLAKIFDDEEETCLSTLPSRTFLHFNLRRDQFLDLSRRFTPHIRRRALRFYHNGNHSLTVRISATAAHDTAPTHFFLKISAAQRTKVGNMSSSRVGLTSLGTASLPIGNAFREADASLISRGVNTKPTVVLESGFTENLTQARSSAESWILTPGSTIQLVILLLIGTAVKGEQNPRIVIEHWVRSTKDPFNVRRDWNANWSTEAAITDYKIPLHLMFEPDTIPPELASEDGNLTVSAENIKNWRSLVRTSWGHNLT